ncbi:hypothetical protein PINS_up001043 [Pythium insidiosum]|nr:hypothetical protein PINS_up001043 [Pythium insidiosum]
MIATAAASAGAGPQVFAPTDCSWQATMLPSFQTFLQSARCTAPTLPTRPQVSEPQRYVYGHAPRMYELALLSARQYVESAPASTASSPSTSHTSFTMALSDDSEHSDEDMMGAVTSTRRSKSLSPPPRTKKKYLKERQRCEIVRRVRAGERQAHLAKEFGVSRAAVCYLLKHQDEILSRSSPTTVVSL